MKVEYFSKAFNSIHKDDISVTCIQNDGLPLKYKVIKSVFFPTDLNILTAI